MADYVPTKEDIVNVVNLLHANGIVVSNSKASYAELKKYEENPSFCILLAVVFSATECPVPELPLTVGWTQYRQLAGITLKNNLTTVRHKLGEKAVTEAARGALQTLKDPSDSRVARAAAQIVVKITDLTSFEWWRTSGFGDLPSILLNELLPLGGLKTLGALYTLQYMMEDLPKAVGGASEAIVAQVSELALSHQSPADIRKAAFRMCFNIYERSSLLDWNVDTLSPLQQGLVNASQRFANVCSSLLETSCGGDMAFMVTVVRSCLFLLDYFDYFGEMSPAIQSRLSQAWVSIPLQMITTCSGKGNEELLAASIDLITSIITTYAQSGGEGSATFLANATFPYVSTMVVPLVKYSVMSDEEVSNIMDSDSYLIRDATAVSFDMKGTKDISEDDLLDEEEASMSLRRSALRCIEALSSNSSAAVFPPLFSEIGRLWGSSEWRDREAGIVLVGTIASGCSSELECHLPSIVEELCRFVSSEAEHVCVSSIAAWSLSRLFESVFALSPHHLGGMIAAIIGRLKSQSKRVQLTCVSALIGAFSLMESYSDTTTMVPYLGSILDASVACLPVYQTRNLSLLVDLLCCALRIMSNPAEIQQLGNLLKQERMRRAQLFVESYTNVYVNQAANALVDKDIFAFDRALVTFLTRSPDGSLALETLRTWCDVLRDVVARGITDDHDLIFNIFLICAAYVTGVPTAQLQQWLNESSWALPTAVYQLMSTTPSMQVKTAAVMLLSGMTRICGNGALPQGMHDVLLQRVEGDLAKEEDPQTKAALVAMIARLVATYPAAVNNAVFSAMTQANAVLRSDVYGDSLYYFSQMAFSMCETMAQRPELCSYFRVDVMSELMSQADNTQEKAVATVYLSQALCKASPDQLAKFMPSVLRAVYSWQQAAPNYPGTVEAIAAMLHYTVQACPNLLQTHIGQLPPAFRDMIVSLYRLQ